MDDLKSKALIRLRAVEVSKRYKVRSVELFYDSFYDVLFVNNRPLRGEGHDGNEYGGHRRESGNWYRLEHD